MIAVFNTEGEMLSEIVENPPRGETLEKALLNILEAAS